MTAIESLSRPATAPPSSRFRNWLGIVIGVTLLASPLLAFLAVGLMMAGMFVPFQLVAYTLFGWLLFICRVLPVVQYDYSGILTGSLACLLFAVGLHLFLKWLYGASSVDVSRATQPEALRPVQRRWQIRWTASIVVLVLVMFVAGISVVGVAHQLIWLATSKQPFISRNHPGFSQKPLPQIDSQDLESQERLKRGD
jgi:hypothetical protein